MVCHAQIDSRASRRSSANDNDNPAIQWPQNELEQFLGCNSPGVTLPMPPGGRRGGLPLPRRLAAPFLSALRFAASSPLLSLYGLTAAVLVLLKIFSS